MSLIARMAYSPQLVWCLIAGRKEKISTEHKLSIWDLGFANGHNTKKIDGTAIWKRFVCSKEGWRKEQESGEDEKPKRKVKITRCGCQAMIGFKRRDDGKYVVAKFISYHTHDLVSPRMRHLIKSNREVTSGVKCALFTCHKASIGTSAAIRMLSVEKGGPANLGCTKKDVQNYERDCRKVISASDAQILIDIMKEK